VALLKRVIGENEENKEPERRVMGYSRSRPPSRGVGRKGETAGCMIWLDSGIKLLVLSVAVDFPWELSEGRFRWVAIEFSSMQRGAEFDSARGISTIRRESCCGGEMSGYTFQSQCWSRG